MRIRRTLEKPSNMGLKDELVLANDPEEEEEEEDLVDPQDTLKDQCKESGNCAKYKDELEVCSDRVNGRSNTEETCDQELYDFMHCVDHCVSKTLFSKLK